MRQPRVRFDRVINPHYTDLAVVVGPNVRYVEDDVQDLLECKPEVLLGYRVKMATASWKNGPWWGQRVAKVVVLDASYNRVELRAITDLMASTSCVDFGKVEGWHVHRARGIWRTW